MRERDALLAGVTGHARARRAREEAAAFQAFRDRFDLFDAPEAVTLYLTALSARGATGRVIRNRLQRLDLDRRLRGLAPWRQEPDVRLFLRGLHANCPVGERRSHYDPLYLELVHAMVDSCRTPSADQRRAFAARSLQATSGVTAASIARLRWRDLHFTKHRLEFTMTTKIGRGAALTTAHHLDALPGDPRCPVSAVRMLRSLGGGEFVFGVDNQPLDVNRLGHWLSARHPLTPTPAQVRDTALLLIGYAAGLRTAEAMALRQRDVQTHDRGLVLTIAGRERLTFLPSNPDPSYDLSAPWTAWVRRMDGQGHRAPDGLAFPATNFSVICHKGLTEAGLNALVHRRTEQAGLIGRYVWSSLRTGMIRTAIRNEVQPHAIAAHADLTSLGSVMRHERRETLLGKGNIAGRLVH